MTDYIYKITEDVEVIEGAKITVYGISVHSDKISEPIYFVEGITSDYKFITEIANCLNTHKPSPIHLKDIIEDILIK